MEHPYTRAVALTLHDSNVLTAPHQALFIGGAGNLKVTLVSGDVVTFNGLAAGSILPVQVKLAWSTGSTATGVLALSRGA